MDPIQQLFSRRQRPMSRRGALRAAGCGLGTLGLAQLLQGATGAENPLAPKTPHYAARAKRVIFLFMHGGPSSIDTFDPKPRLDRDHGKPLPIQRPLAFADESPGPLMKSPWAFKPGGKSGIPVSDLFPHTRDMVDELCVIRSLVGEGVDHGAALLQTFTGSSTFVRPSMGAWTVYGLGTENQDLPGYITIKPTLSHGGAKNFGAAFLPGAYQATPIGHSGMKVDEIKAEPIQYLVNKGLTPEQQRFELDMIQNINRKHQELRSVDTNLEARIQAFELAFRMQTQAPEIFAVDKESEATKKLYGLDDPKTADFGWQCLLARRLCEKGVRFVQCTHSYKWDQHGDLYAKHTENAYEVDKPIAGLLKDLKARGLLKDTLVIWAGEFGRSPDNGVRRASKVWGRDHNATAMPMWFAGGGVKAGHVIGATDEIGEKAVEIAHPLKDVHCTILSLLGLDDAQLTYFHGGRFKQLSQVGGQVIRELIA